MRRVSKPTLTGHERNTGSDGHERNAMLTVVEVVGIRVVRNEGIEGESREEGGDGDEDGEDKGNGDTSE